MCPALFNFVWIPIVSTYWFSLSPALVPSRPLFFPLSWFSLIVFTPVKINKEPTEDKLLKQSGTSCSWRKLSPNWSHSPVLGGSGLTCPGQLEASVWCVLTGQSQSEAIACVQIRVQLRVWPCVCFKSWIKINKLGFRPGFVLGKTGFNPVLVLDLVLVQSWFKLGFSPSYSSIFILD